MAIEEELSACFVDEWMELIDTKATLRRSCVRVHLSDPVLRVFLDVEPDRYELLMNYRNTMLYFQHQTYLSSQDEGGMRFCNRHRAMMLGAYWLTAISGAALVVTLAVSGWEFA